METIKLRLIKAMLNNIELSLIRQWLKSEGLSGQEIENLIQEAILEIWRQNES